MKYKINREFFPYSKLKPPLSKSVIKMAQKVMGPPKFFFKDKSLIIDKIQFPTYDDELISSYIISPISLLDNSPCIIYFHGGGFVFEAANYHYKLAMEYAKKTNSKVFFIKYRLSPRLKLPEIVMDTYYAFKYIYNNNNLFNIDINNFALAGDSAGGFLAANLTSLLIKENINIKCLLLVYPFLDNSLSSESTKTFTDTPMWNSKLSVKILEYILPDGIKYTSPIAHKDYTDFPPTYIEIAEYDSLKDDGKLYHKLLKNYNIETELYEIPGTMHGFDIKYNAKTSIDAINNRISFLNKHLNQC